MQHKYLTTNGVWLHYVTQGDGPLMLFLHGFPEFWYSWRHQISEFARDYTVVAIDLRGYNTSDKPTEQSAYALPELIKDVAGIIRTLGYDQCTLVGHDWGGAIAIPLPFFIDPISTPKWPAWSPANPHSSPPSICRLRPSSI